MSLNLAYISSASPDYPMCTFTAPLAEVLPSPVWRWAFFAIPERFG